MAAFGRSSVFVVCIAVFSTLLLQNMHHDAMLEGIPSGKTRVVDLSYAINDKLVPWPGDGKFFEAKVNATIEKNGYFTRSFWMLEHYGTHLDAPAHFPPGKTTVDQIPVKQLFGPAVVIDVRAENGTDGFPKGRLCCCGRVGRRGGRMCRSTGIRMQRGRCTFRDSPLRQQNC